MEYRTSLDNRAKFITVVCFLLFAYLVYKNPVLVNIPPWIRILLTILYFVTFVGAYLYAPNKYIVKSGMLIIVRPIKRIIIPLADIKEVRLLNKEELGTLIRMFGSGGLFGYYGTFKSTRMGKLKLYTTRRNNRIMLTTVDEERILISPDDLSIIDALKV
jgi:hypothetical protein